MIPVKLTLINFISHLHSTLDFTKFRLALIVGSYEGNPNIANGIGKTSIMDAIRFALFGRSRFNTKTKLVKRGKESCQVEFIFSVAGEVYKIVRKLSVKTGIITVDFSKRAGNDWIFKGWTCDTPTQTNNKIIELIGMNDETFVNISYFRQNDVSGFTSANATKRKEILKECLKLNIWDEYQKVSKESERFLNQQLLNVEDRLQFLGDIEGEIKAIDKKIKEKKSLLDSAKNEMIEVEDALKECNDNIADTEISIVKKGMINSKDLKLELSEINERETEISLRKDKIQDLTKINNELLSKANNDCNLLNKRKIQYFNDILITDHRNRDEIVSEFSKSSSDSVPIILYNSKSLEKNQVERDKIKKIIDENNFDLKKLLTLEPGNECPTCLSIIENPQGIIKRRNTKKKFLENRIIEQGILLKEIDSLIKIESDMIKKAEIAYVEIERTNLIIAKRMATISEIENEYERNQRELKNLSDEWQRLKNKKKNITTVIDGINNKTNLNENLSQLNDLRKKIEIKLNFSKENIMKFSLECGNLAGHRESLERKLSEKQILDNKKNELSSSIAVYSKLTSAFGKDGIQAIIMENITEDLRQYTNSILKSIYYKPISIDFITQRKTSTGTWREDFEILINIDNETYDFEDISGGEQVRVSIALRLALSQILMRRVGSNIQFILFDEVDQSLDKHGLEALYETILELSKEFKILVISHSDYMKEKFENIITVHMNSSGSVLR